SYFLTHPLPPIPTLFPYTTLFRSNLGAEDTTSPYSTNWNTTSASNGSHTLTAIARDAAGNRTTSSAVTVTVSNAAPPPDTTSPTDRKSTRLNSSHVSISYAVFCLK